MKASRNLNHMKMLALILGACTILCYIPALNLGFVNWDDNVYVYENSHILSLNSRFVQWAFTTFETGNWHPLTWLSLGLDRLVWGVGPMGFHATNIVLHGLNTALVTIIVWMLIVAAKNAVPRGEPEITFSRRGMMTAAAVTGILFGFHPIHVESVAWISERKDVLCAFFFLSGIATYLKYVEIRSLDMDGVPFYSARSFRLFIATLMLFALALLSKPMAVTFPAVLLILDWHPLGRFERERIMAIVLEKLPFIVLSIVSSTVTIVAQKSIGDILSFSYLPFTYRVINGARAFVLYIWKMLIPINLVPFYSYPVDVSLVTVRNIGIITLIVGLVFSCVISAQSRIGRSWTAAWSYYLITLIPVIGFVQVGNQSMADRYTYLPSIGPFILVGLGLTLVFERTRKSVDGPSFDRYYALLIVGILAITLSYLTARQTGVWKDGLTLWNYVIEKNPASFAKVYNNRGIIYLEQGRPKEALQDFNKAIESSPGILKWYFNRAAAYRSIGNYDKALEDLNKVLKWDPRNITGYVHRGNTYFLMGRYGEAISDFSKAITLNPDIAILYFDRGIAYRHKKEFALAIEDFNRSISLNASFADAYAYSERGLSYMAVDRDDDAMNDFSVAISINPNVPRYYYNRGTIFARKGLFEQAVSDYSRAISMSAESKYEYYMNRGIALKKIGRLKEGERDLMEAKRIKMETLKTSK